MARLVAEEGLDLDVATGGELHVALHAGVPGRADRVPRQQQVDRRAARRARRPASAGSSSTRSTSSTASTLLAARDGDAPAVLVRVTPGVEAHTHEFIETGTDDSKFGFGLQNGDALRAVEARRRERRRCGFAGLHCHIGSQVFRLDSFAAAVDRMVGLVREVEHRHRRDGRRAEPRRRARRPLRVDRRGRRRSRSTRSRCTRCSPRRSPRTACGRAPPLTVEPGRSIAAPSGITLYTVGTIKEIPGVRTYVAVDGGMSDNLRPVTYGARLRGVPPGAGRGAAPAVVTVAGKHCEQGDVLVRDAHLPGRRHGR